MALGPNTWEEFFFKALRRTVDPSLSYTTHLSDTGSGAYGNVNGHGVRIVWQSVELGAVSTAVLSIAPGPVDSIDKPMLRAEEITVTTDRDPDEVASEVQPRLSAAKSMGPVGRNAARVATSPDENAHGEGMNENEKMALWERAFWRAFDVTDPAWRWQQKFDTLPGGRTILGSLGTIDGRGVRVVWQSARSAVVTMAREPVESLDAVVPRAEQTQITTDGDPAAVATYVRKRIAAMT